MPTLLRSQVAPPLALAILAIVAGAAPSAAAEVHIAGVPGAVRLEANDATLDEALTALGASFGLRYRTAVDLGDRISGTYQGPIGRVVSRLLKDHNFVVRTSSGGVEVSVLENSSARAVQGPPISGAVQGPQISGAVQGPQSSGPERVAAAVQGDPTIAGLKRALPTTQQNPAGARRIDVAQPLEVKPPDVRN